MTCTTYFPPKFGMAICPAPVSHCQLLRGCVQPTLFVRAEIQPGLLECLVFVTVPVGNPMFNVQFKPETITGRCQGASSDVALICNVPLSEELRPQDKDMNHASAVRKHCSSVLINGITAMPKINSRTDLF